MKTLLLILAASLFLSPALQALTPAELAQIERDAYNAEMARLLALKQAGQRDETISGPQKPGRSASKAEWDAYNNAVAAWNQRTAAQQQQDAAEAQARAAERTARVQAKIRQERAAEAAQAKAAADAAYQRQIQERQTQAMEALVQAQQLELLRKMGKLPK